MQNIALENGPVRIVGALDVDRRQTGIVPRRLPNWTRPQVPLFMEIMVTMPSGVRFEFATTSRRIELDVLPTRIEISKPPAPAMFDLVIDGKDVRSVGTECGDRLKINLADRGKATRVRGDAGTVAFTDLPAGLKHCELWLPANAILEVRGLRIDDGAKIEAPSARAPTPLGASRQFDQPLHGSDEPDGHVARRCRAPCKRGIAQSRARRQLPPRSVRRAHDARRSTPTC